jgi:hypothetical protein
MTRAALAFFVLTGSALSMLAAPILAAAALLAVGGWVPAAAEDTVQMLFVQSAEGVEFSDGKMRSANPCSTATI